MRKKRAKIKIIKTTQKGVPKDMTTAVVETMASKGPKVPNTHDPRIPAASTVITRKYKGEELKVKVLENGFEYKGQIFRSISAVAVHIVGGPISGYTFFKLGEKNDQRRKNKIHKTILWDFRTTGGRYKWAHKQCKRRRERKQ